MGRLLNLWQKIKRLLRAIPPLQPGPLSLATVEEGEEMQQFLYTIKLPAVESRDVVKRELSVTTNKLRCEATPSTERIINLPVNAKEYKLKLNEGLDVSLKLVDIDAEGNRSMPSELLTFQTKDTIAPKKPGNIRLGTIEELPMIEEVIEDKVEVKVEHTHCGGSTCDKTHEHCPDHTHCSEEPCTKEHEHCGEGCEEAHEAQTCCGGGKFCGTRNV